MPAAKESGVYSLVPPIDEPNDVRYSEEATLMDKDFPTRKSKACSILPKALCAFTVVVLYSIALVQITWHTSKAGRTEGTRFMKSLANDFIKYEPRVFHQFERPFQNVTYFTKPDPEVDRNWHNLFEHQNIRLPKHVMEELDRVDEGIELPGGGFFGSIMVFHHLHCIKNLYHALHPGYYNLTKLTQHEKDMMAEHNDKIIVSICFEKQSCVKVTRRS
ncbi:hypothetical protein LX32DRAFT_720921 [Colletotrichum zoysiae]|uniref:Tat pathway signal sequence n=1 Tax=Colletotrichum zoysiae TaxID=1216348 RepID=A0AAD9HHI7_9PEZI|nr:hypothetical protein LX32DRAFT_720921 [Colletotrichum zoysiae]